MKRNWIMLVAALALVLPSSLKAQDWPNRAVRVIVPFGAGGSGDAIARLLSEQLSTTFGQQFVVENRTGAGGAIGAQAVATSQPDGYTIGITNLSILSIVPVVNASTAYDPIKSFVHIAYAAGAPVVLAANTKTDVKTLDQFRTYAADKKAFTFASSGVGSDGHLMGEAIAASLKLTVEHVPYKNTSQALIDVVGGHVPFCTFTLSSTAQFMRDGTLNGIAVTTAERLPDFPNLPTFRELGYPELEGTTWFSLSGPANMPADIAQKLNAEINKILERPEVLAKLRRDGFQTRPMSPADFTAFVGAENTRWRALIERAGLAGKGG